MITALIIYYFLPHVSNNHRAHLLNPILICISILMFIASQVAVAYLPRYAPVVLAQVSNISPEEIIKLTNKERAKAGVPEVQVDPLLTQAALAKSSYMLAKNYWAHTAPDGTEPWKFVMDTGYKYRFAGENLARDFTTSDAVVSAWMSSPSHKENLVSTRYQDIGVAVVKGEFDGVQTSLVVQFFGTRMVNATNVPGGESKQIASVPQLTLPKVESLIAESIPANKILLSPFATTKSLAFFLISLFCLVLSIDMILVHKNNILRISSKSFAHLLFFGMVLAVIYFSRSGIIL